MTRVSNRVDVARMATRMGRPPRADASSTARIEIRCTIEERDRWRSHAESERVDLGQAIRSLLDRWANGEIKLRR